MTTKKISDFIIAGTSGDFTLSHSTSTAIVLYFYPKDNTPGCTTEGADFRDHFNAFKAIGVDIYGISRDSLKSHQSFKSKMAFPFELLADPDETVCTLFDVMKMKNMYGRQVRGVERSTFIISKDRTLLKEWRGVKVPGHVAEVLEFAKTLRVNEA